MAGISPRGLPPAPAGTRVPGARAAGTRAAGTLVAGVLVAVALLATGCAPAGPASPADAPSPAPRAVTAEEAQLLAVARFRNFDAGTRSFSTELRDAGHELSLAGWYDYAAAVGYAALSDSGSPNGLLTWQDATLAVHAPAGADAPLPPPGVAESPDASWRSGPIDPAASTLHAALAFVAELGATRPENPLLLQQGGALWLREDSVDGAPVTVFAGPPGLAADADAASASPQPTQSRVHYWVDSTGLLLRVEVLFGASWVTIDLGPADGVSLAWSVPEPTA